MGIYKIYYAMRLLRWVVLEILTYYVYAPVSVLHPPCTRTAHHNFMRCPDV
jgi:hypothetical protein